MILGKLNCIFQKEKDKTTKTPSKGGGEKGGRGEGAGEEEGKEKALFSRC